MECVVELHPRRLLGAVVHSKEQTRADSRRADSRKLGITAPMVMTMCSHTPPSNMEVFVLLLLALILHVVVMTCENETGKVHNV